MTHLVFINPLTPVHLQDIAQQPLRSSQGTTSSKALKLPREGKVQVSTTADAVSTSMHGPGESKSAAMTATPGFS